MKTNNLFYILTFLCLSITSCSVDTIRIDSNDYVTTNSLAISDYSAIEIATDFTAYVTFSETEESIIIEANDNLHEHIIATYENDALIVKLKNNINIKGSKTLNVYITTPSITSFKASADARITLENELIGNYAKIKLSADSYFSGQVDLNHLEYFGSADTDADLYGKVNFLEANLSADSKLSDYNLLVDDLKIKMSADCDAFLTVEETIDIDAVADCVLRYKGSASIIKQHLAADSRIIKVD